MQTKRRTIMRKHSKTTYRQSVIDTDIISKKMHQYFLIIGLVLLLIVSGSTRFDAVVSDAAEGKQEYQHNDVVDNITTTSTNAIPLLTSRLNDNITYCDKLVDVMVKNDSTTMESSYQVIDVNSISVTPDTTTPVVENKEDSEQPDSGKSEPAIEEVIETQVEEPIPEPVITYRIEISNEERAVLERITEAEVTGGTGKGHGITDQQMLECKIRVAQVIIARLESQGYGFPNTISGVVFQKKQFSPIGDKRYWKVTVTDLTRQAVELALRTDTQNYVDNALFFTAGKKCGAKATYLFTDPIGHSFFAPK